MRTNKDKCCCTDLDHFSACNSHAYIPVTKYICTLPPTCLKLNKQEDTEADNKLLQIATSNQFVLEEGVFDLIDGMCKAAQSQVVIDEKKAEKKR